MSSVDRAFIRAYSRQTATTPLAEEPATVAPVVPVPLRRVAEQHAAQQRAMQRHVRLETAGAGWGTGVATPHVTSGVPATTPLPAGTVPEPSAARAYGAWTALPARALVPPMATPRPASGEEQLKIAMGQLRATVGSEGGASPAATAPPMASALFDVAVAHTEETIRHASVAPPVLEPVQHIDSMATWNANSPALAQSYLCVVEEIDPKLWPAEVAAVNLPVEEPPTSKAGILPEVESTAPAVSQPISSLVEEVSSASGPSPTAPPPTIAPSTLEVQWEVDHFLYPAVTEQLLSSYPYFKQAGEKLLKATQAGMKVMAITGVGRQEGRTTLAICLARAAARAGLRVGLIDADFTSPALASQLGVEVEQGWEAVLRGSTTLAEIAVRAVEEGITLYPWLASGDAPAPQLSTPGVMEVVQQAATTNQLLLLDLGPWSATGLKKIVRLPFDAALVVRDLRSRELDDLLPIANWLHEAGVEAVGIAENFAPLS